MVTRRIGLLVPSSNSVMELDFHRALDGLANVHTDRMYMVDTTREGEQYMLDHEAVPAARRIATVEPDAVVFGCTSASSLHGAQYDQEFRDRLEKTTGVPVLGVLTSAIAELEGAGRVGLFTPYIDELTATIADSLQAAGVQVVVRLGLGIDNNFDIGLLTPHDVTTAVLGMDLSDVDTIFCSCTNLRAMEARQTLIEQTGRSVVTSNHAVIRHVERFLEQSASPSSPEVKSR